MIEEEILELYNTRRQMLTVLLTELKNVGDHAISHDHSNIETHDLIGEMSDVTNRITELCNGDYVLVDMYRRLSLAIAKEYYEDAINIKKEINNHK